MSYVICSFFNTFADDTLMVNCKDDTAGYKEVIIYISDNSSLIWSCLFTIKDPLKKDSNSELSTPVGVIAIVEHIWCRSFFDRKMAFFKGT